MKLAQHTYDLQEQLGLEGSEGLAMVPLTTITACLGDVEAARRYARRGLELASASGNRPALVLHHGVLGLLALSLGDPAGAAVELAAAERILLPLRIRDPGMFTILPDHAEALAALAKPDEAAATLEPYARISRKLDRPWSMAIASRCRGIISAAHGDAHGALAEFTQALEHHEQAGDPFQLARTLLALGTSQRRSRRRRDARESLERAAEIFDQLGARLWAATARAELQRVSGRAKSAGGLTASEGRLAELVAEGRTHREVAAELSSASRPWNRT